jgi:protein-disulfide isomerase
VKRALSALSALVVCLPLFAIDLDPKVDRSVRALMPVCDDAKLVYSEFNAPLPTGFKGFVVSVQSARPSCEGDVVGITSPTGGLYLGMPWLIGDEEGKGAEEKLKNFMWRNLQENVTVTIERGKASEDGLIKVNVAQATEAGPMVTTGFLDPAGRVFYMGNFRRMSGDVAAERSKALETWSATAPAKGASKPKVTIVEFSDFQCPSCKRASGFVEPIVTKHPDSVRYVRFDLPLTMHPWAFPASLAGRAVFQQKPELFWQYKHDVYENQGELNAFMFWDWARNWASDHDLDLAKYDAALNDAQLKKHILDGAGAAFSNDVRATPTYMVNGVMVDAGDAGKGLAAYVEALLAK